MIYDIIIVGAGAAGLFAGINLDKKLNKLILEKTNKPGTKVLLSGGERANISNIDIEVERDYFGQNKKALISIFKKFNQWDIMTYFSSVGINIVEEDRGRLILESGDSRELVETLIKEVNKNNCEIKVNSEVISVLPFSNPSPRSSVLPLQKEEIKGVYEIITKEGKKYLAKNVIVSSGGKSFFQVGTTGDGYNFAKDFGIRIISPYRSLCGLATKKDLSEISGVSSNVEMNLVDSNPSSSVILQRLPLKKEENKRKIIYKENGPILFTHFGVSGPIIHNLSNAIGEYLNSLKLDESEFENYILNNLSIDLKFDLENTAKRIIKFFDLIEDNLEINLELQNWRSWKETKATGGGVDINELDNNMQSKKYKGLYFIGEVVDITGKTGGFNLQWAWSSAFVAAKNINLQ